jgi:hypothetical protein
LLHKGNDEIYFKAEMSRHIKYHLYINDKDTGISTVISHGSGSKEISEKIIKYMAQQLYLSTQEFKTFIGCKYYLTDILAIYKRDRII